ncbi:hypothetical protein SAMN06298216_0243 [Spirosomataceae bacterium TFI 002]|nr:hypothetical protein SAMN06298216_0243 [Spirosomataceae bacterium TFI 002]
MKKSTGSLRGLLTILFLVSSSTSFAQSTDEQAIKAVIQNSFDAIFSGGESPLISDYYTDDFLLLEHGEVWNNDTIQVYIDKMALAKDRPKRTNTFEFIKIEIEGNRAWVAYQNYALLSKNGEVLRKLHWLESGDLIKTQAGWRLQLLHSTRVPLKN